MTTTKKKSRRKPRREIFYRTLGTRGKRCRDCSQMIPAGEVYFFRREGWIVLCCDCGKGIDAIDSDAYTKAHGAVGWLPSKTEMRILRALLDEPLSPQQIGAEISIHPGKTQGLLGHLRARKCVVKIDKRYELSATGLGYLREES